MRDATQPGREETLINKLVTEIGHTSERKGGTAWGEGGRQRGEPARPWRWGGGAQGDGALPSPISPGPGGRGNRILALSGGPGDFSPSHNITL